MVNHKLQYGLEKGKLDKRGIVKLLFQQLVGTGLEKVFTHWKFIPLTHPLIVVLNLNFT